MTDPVSNLKKIIAPESLEEVPKDGCLILKENSPNNSYQAELKNAPSGSILIKIDNFSQQEKFIAGNNKGIRKRADYALVTGEKIIFMEMKSKKPRRTIKKEVERQFHGAECVMAYCAAIGEYFFNDPHFLLPAIENKSCVCLFVSGSIHKKRTVPESPKSNGSAFKKLKCGRELYYKQLIT